jgi:hypothetical protein
LQLAVGERELNACECKERDSESELWRLYSTWLAWPAVTDTFSCCTILVLYVQYTYTRHLVQYLTGSVLHTRSFHLFKSLTAFQFTTLVYFHIDCNQQFSLRTSEIFHMMTVMPDLLSEYSSDQLMHRHPHLLPLLVFSRERRERTLQ